MLVVLIGGVKSRKSSAAVAMTETAETPVVFIATGEPLDNDMAERIKHHRAERPAHWETFETPRKLDAVVGKVDPSATIIIDCLTLWVTNLMLDEPPSTKTRILKTAELLAWRLKTRAGTTIVVTNEVGSGVIPTTPLGREFCDLLGLVNQAFMRAADQAYLVIAGRILPLAEPTTGYH